MIGPHYDRADSLNHRSSMWLHIRNALFVTKPYSQTAGLFAGKSAQPVETSQAARQRAAWAVVSLVTVVMSLLVLASPAFASEEITSFTTSSSDTTAGAHPDLFTSFTLENPGAPEAAQNITFDPPRGVFGDPNATTKCTPADFSFDRCPSDSQIGLITVYANYEGNHEDLLGTAPIFNLEPPTEQAALFAFIAPTVNIPIQIPVSIRTATTLLVVPGTTASASLSLTLPS